jgi:MFS family permease
MSLDARSATQKTYQSERWRAIAAGILETAGTTFLILIAVRYFEAGPTAKALIAAGGSVGLLLTPWIVSHVESMGWKITHAAAFLLGMASLSFLLAAALPFLPVYIFCCVFGMACAATIVPFMIQVYQENYPESERGGLFGKTVMIRVAAAMLFSELGGRLLKDHIGRFQWILLIFSATLAFACFCVSRCPSRALVGSGRTHPLRAMRFVREDRLFRWTLISWMLLGFANLMMMPMRVEYLANPQFGLALDVSSIALITGVVPNFTRLIVSPFWGKLFDRMNFFMLRVMVNIGFGVGILTFFTGDTFWGWVTAGAIFGLSSGGADVAWSLWVTKFAPRDRVADYMAVHTCFTGLRGVVAPLVAFHLVSKVSMAAMGWASATLILIASLMLLPEIKFKLTPRPKTPLVEKSPEL